jgi:hypothetical protein
MFHSQVNIILSKQQYMQGTRKISTQNLHQILLKLTGTFKMQIDMNLGKDVDSSKHKMFLGMAAS